MNIHNKGVNLGSRNVHKSTSAFPELLHDTQHVLVDTPAQRTALLVNARSIAHRTV